MTIRLRIIPPQGEANEQTFPDEPLVIGRAADCDLVIDDRFLSRRHARLEPDDGGWWVEDLGSRNGTRVNDELLSAPLRLAPGDVITLSGSEVMVRGEGDEATALPAEGASRGTEATYYRSARALLLQSSHPSVPVGAQGNDHVLRRWAERLHVVNDVHRRLARSLTLEEVLEGVLDRVFDHLQPERGAVYLRREGSEGGGSGNGSSDGNGDGDGNGDRNGTGDGDSTGSGDGGGDGGGPGYRLAAHRSVDDAEPLRSSHLLREVADKGLAALVLDARTDQRFSAAHSMLDVGVRSVVAAPLLAGEESLGMIALDSHLTVRKFEREDMELLVSLAAAAALRIDNLALAEEAAERRRLESELALARRIQLALLPERLPEPAGWLLHGGNQPSRGVSGDFYEVVPRRRAGESGDRDETFLVLADVSGKGMAASLLTASLEALMAPLIEEGLPPDEIAQRTGRLLYARTPPEKYATSVLAVLEAGSGRVRYTGAGHNPSLLLRAAGDVEIIDNTGPPLGLLPDPSYTAAVLELAPGDTLFAYTDGLVEATDPDGEEYGLERLRDTCARHRMEPLVELMRLLEADIERFVRGTPFADDRTVLLARRR